MNKISYDLAVAYRIYPKISKDLAINVNDKFILAELCLKSFKESLGKIKVKIWVLLDNCPPKYEDLFKKYFNKEDLELIKLPGIGNYATFDLQLKILTEQNDSEVIYFAEDDFFYLPNQFKSMISFLTNNSGVDYVTPYDYNSFYTYLFHRSKSYIRLYKDRHWRTINSIGCNFMSTKKLVKKNIKIFKIYSKGKTALISSWICLNKYKIFNPFSVRNFASEQRMFYYYYYKAWRYGWKQILFGRKSIIWSPIPAIATAMDKGELAPTINWNPLFNKMLNEIVK